MGLVSGAFRVPLREIGLASGLRDPSVASPAAPAPAFQQAPIAEDLESIGHGNPSTKEGAVPPLDRKLRQDVGCPGTPRPAWDIVDYNGVIRKRFQRTPTRS